MQNIRIRVGRRVRELRRALGWSQERLGEGANLHPTYVGGIERGERNVSLDNLAKLSQALRVSLAELFDFPVEQKGEDDLLRLRIKQLVAQQDEAALRFSLTFHESLLEFQRRLLRSQNENEAQGFD